MGGQENKPLLFFTMATCVLPPPRCAGPVSWKKKQPQSTTLSHVVLNVMKKTSHKRLNPVKTLAEEEEDICVRIIDLAVRLIGRFSSRRGRAITVRYRLSFWFCLFRPPASSELLLYLFVIKPVSQFCPVFCLVSCGCPCPFTIVLLKVLWRVYLFSHLVLKIASFWFEGVFEKIFF